MQVFFSHSSKDEPWVQWIARQIEAAVGSRVYLAQHDPKAGGVLSEKVRAEIAKSDVLIVLLTTVGCSSPYVQQEIGVALEQGKIIIPLVHPDVAEGSLGMLAGVEHILFDFDSPPGGLSDLLARVRELEALAAQRERIETVLLLVGLVLVGYLATRAIPATTTAPM